MSLGSVVLLTVIWSATFEVLTTESFYDNGKRRNRHKYHRRHLFSGENNGYERFHDNDSPPLQQYAPSSLQLDDDNEDQVADSTFELDRPLPVEQVAVPVGGKAYLPCDTRSSSGRDNEKSADSSGFFMVMWFREPKDEANPEDGSYGRPATTSSTSGEPIFTYDTRQSSVKISNPPRSWSSPAGFGDRAYFHTSNSDLQNDQDLVDHLTVDRAIATDTGVYRCRVDFLKAPTRNRLVNLTVIIAPDRPKIYFEYGNSIGGDRPENYQQDSGNIVVIDEGSPTVTLVCRVNGGWPQPRLTWYHENTVLDSTYQLSADGGDSRGRRKTHHDRHSAVTVNRLLLTNLTRWHPIMSRRQRNIGTSRLTCQASNSVLNGFSRPPIAAGDGNMPPPATTEHTFIRLNLRPTEVQITSIKENRYNFRTNESHAFDKNEVLASEDTVGHKKYTIRADRMYRAECRSKGSRPLATTEWYLLKKNQRYNVDQSTNITGLSSPMILEGATANIVETQQTPSIMTDKDEMVITTSVLHFTLRGPKSAVTDENDNDEAVLVCRAYNPVIKTSDRQYVETKIALDVQYPPVVELRFGNRMLDTGRIGPGDDVYFECTARANPSTTIRYSWYHNGVRLTQDAEKKRTDDEDKRGEKKNSRLASRVIQYSQLGSLVLQSVKIAAAGKYACQATNGIENDSIENKTMSNTVRLLVKHVPVCQHREDVLIVAAKSDTAAVPAIRCRAGRGHPPTVEYRWTFYPERTGPPDGRDGGESVGPDGMPYAGRETGPSIAQTAVQTGDGGTSSYTFTTSTPTLRSYLSAVSAAVPDAARANLLRGRLECRAVNTMGEQIRPCVYRITDKTSINPDNKDLQEITDCQPIPRKELSDEVTNDTFTMTYPCSVKVEDIVTGIDRRIRFCIICTLNASSLHRHRPRLNYVLQLYKTVRGETPSTVLIAFNVTGVVTTEDSGNNRTNVIGPDDADYYFDPDGGDILVDERNDYSLDTTNVMQKVVFVIDDNVKPGIYRGKIVNSDKGTLSTMVKGIINVAAVTIDSGNDSPSNYIIDDVEDDTDGSTLARTWRRVTIALVEMVCSSADPREELDGAARRGRRLRRQAASVVLTAVLVAVVAALSCGICGAVAVLYRRRRRCGPGPGPGPGLGPGPGPVCDDDDDEDADGDGTGKTAADGARERPPAAAGTCRPTDHDEDAPDGRDADALRPLLRAQRNCREPARRQPNDKTNARTAHVASAEDDRRGGPDVVMSTAATPAHTDMPSGNWQQKHQSRQLTFNATNSNHQWSLQRLEFQKPNTTISRPKATLSATTPRTTAVVFTNNHTKPKTIQTVMDEPLSVTSQALLNALHRESSI